MNERIKDLRKELGLSQAEFASRIGLSQHTVSYMEKKGGSITNSNIMLICHEFNVSDNWLRTGTGDMFVPPDVSDTLTKLEAEYDMNPIERAIAEIYLKSDPIVRQVVSRFVVQLLEEVQSTEEVKPSDNKPTGPV